MSEITEADLAALKDYWTAPTGKDRAPDYLIAHAEFTVNRLCAEIERLNVEVMEHQAGDGYEKGYEHGYAAAMKHLRQFVNKMAGDTP